MNYKVEIDQSGRGGRVSYIENERPLNFDWEFAVNGVDLFVPPPEKWDAYWQSSDADWAKGRRQEILERVADEVRKQKAAGAEVTIEDNWIHFGF
jgi:hypothetical protein